MIIIGWKLTWTICPSQYSKYISSLDPIGIYYKMEFLCAQIGITAVVGVVHF